MDLEKDMLNKELVQLEASGDKAGVEKLREDAELMGHGDVVEKADAIIAQLTKLAEEVAPDPENKKALVEELGGTVEELESREEPVDQEIEAVEETAENAIGEKVIGKVENQEEFKTNDQGKKYEYEKNGTFYGGDYLAELPAEIYIDTETPALEKQVDPELLKELEQAKKNSEYELGKYREATEKQGDYARHESDKEYAKNKLALVADFEEQYKDLLDKEITISSGNDKHMGDRISFKGLSEYDNRDLVGKRGISEVVSNVVLPYESDHDGVRDPQRVFKAKEETTLGKLFADYKQFLEAQLNIPKPTQSEVDFNQQEVNVVSASMLKANEEVKRIEAKIKEEETQEGK